MPTEVAALASAGVVALGGGGHHAVALCADGRCLAWGRVDSGQLGVGLQKAAAGAGKERLLSDARGRPRACLEPAEVDIGRKAKAVAVACGTEHTLIVTSDARCGGQNTAVFGAGFNSQMQLGLGAAADEEVLVPTRLEGKALQNRRLAWAGSGGQYSMVAGPRRAGV